MSVLKCCCSQNCELAERLDCSETAGHEAVHSVRRDLHDVCGRLKCAEWADVLLVSSISLQLPQVALSVPQESISQVKSHLLLLLLLLIFVSQNISPITEKDP